MGPTFVAVVLALAVAVAPSSQGQIVQVTEVPGRVVVEPSYPTPFPEEFTLTFVDAAGTAVAEIALSESVKTTNFRNVRGGLIGEVRLQVDGKFRVLLPRGPSLRELRVIVRKRPGPKAAATETYYLKAVHAGDVNLLEKPLTVTSPFTGEIVVTLAQCTEQTRRECA